MKELIHYDNEKDLKLLVDDCTEFIMTETARIVDSCGGTCDGNMYLLVSQNLTNSLVLNVLNRMRLIDMAFVAGVNEQKSDDTSNHLPINGPDFFRGMKP